MVAISLKENSGDLRKRPPCRKLGLLSQRAAETMGFRLVECGSWILIKLKKCGPCLNVTLWQKTLRMVYRIKKRREYYLSDPAYGLITFVQKRVLLPADWPTMRMSRPKKAFTLLLEATSPTLKAENGKIRKASLRFLFRYLFNYKNLNHPCFVSDCWWAVCYSLIFPFYNQSIVDVWSRNQDIWVYYYIGAVCSGSCSLWRSYELWKCSSWILLHLSNPRLISPWSPIFSSADGTYRSPILIPAWPEISCSESNDHRRIIEKLLTGPHSALFRFLNLMFLVAVWSIIGHHYFF